MRYYFKSINLIGDGMCISPAWRQWYEVRRPTIVDEVYMQTLPDHTAPLYAGMVRDLPYKQPVIVFERPEGNFNFEHVFDVNKAFQISDQKKCHVAESYAEDLGVTLPGEFKRPGEYNPRVKPTYIVATGLAYSQPYKLSVSEKAKEKDTLDALSGCILISMFSASCTSRDAKTKGLPPNKMLPWDKWKPMIRYLRVTFPDSQIRFVGAPTDMVPNGYAEDIVRPGEYMLGIPLNRLALIMKFSKLVVTIDNGMGHMAASQEANMFLMYPQCLSLSYILPVGNPNLYYVHMNPVYVNPAQLVYGLKQAIQKFKLAPKEDR